MKDKYNLFILRQIVAITFKDKNVARRKYKPCFLNDPICIQETMVPHSKEQVLILALCLSLSHISVNTAALCLFHVAAGKREECTGAL